MVFSVIVDKTITKRQWLQQPFWQHFTLDLSFHLVEIPVCEAKKCCANQNYLLNALRIRLNGLRSVHCSLWGGRQCLDATRCRFLMCNPSVPLDPRQLRLQLILLCYG